ncbi:GDSL-like lipase/acylhydrolase superfamily protein [Perilla frutescens var. hirtella]|uniref:GDSL-like lipase/acylhydrolase superfamily protein n=1 Tax=Perilla frutescens var. hirtella TaxID=608512 RepID=A0AAD4PF19_PERFH|nr:GDSL-like lipase/acylhydrolase superfamily protein [Perilla frutescens var. hirtella]
MAISNSSVSMMSYIFLILFVVATHAQPLVPALIIFGDSVVDVGNNNNLETIVKANFQPYGRDFIKHKSTGRFCNGKLASDYTAENLGFTSYPPPYLSKQATGKHLLIGANFASGSSGYYDSTAKIYNTISLSKQVELYKDYQSKLVTLVGQSNATSIINGSIHFVSAGSSDFVQNYYINPLLYEKYTTDQFTDILLQIYNKFVQELYNLGARKIGVTTLPPLGCVPAVITIFGEDRNDCVEKINKVAVSFNNKLNSTSQKLQSKLSGLNLVVLDIYQPLHDLVMHPTDYGFFEARKACCGTGLVETSILCNAESPGTCKNATEYVFWDGFHPTDAANKLKDARQTPSQVAFSLGGILFQRAWIQGVLVSVPSSSDGDESGRYLLDDGTGVIELSPPRDFDRSQWESGMYVMVVGGYHVRAGDLPLIRVHKTVDLSPFPDRESMWYLEVMEAFKIFYQPLFQE